MIQRRLGAAANIVCTQPRRISTVGLAERISAERCQATGEEVGYAIRGEVKRTPGLTRITFVTTDILLRRLRSGDQLNEVSHVVVDEVQERTVGTDLVLALLRDTIAMRTDLKVVLVSTTTDANAFAESFLGCPRVRTVQVQGRTFPVQKFHLERLIEVTGYTGDAECEVHRVDPAARPEMYEILAAMGDRINYNLLGKAVAYIDRWLRTDIRDSDGGILIFLPGMCPFPPSLICSLLSPSRTLSSPSPLVPSPLHPSPFLPSSPPQPSPPISLPSPPLPSPPLPSRPLPFPPLVFSNLPSSPAPSLISPPHESR